VCVVGTYTVKYLRSEPVTLIAFWSNRPAMEIVCYVLKLVPHSICMSQHLLVVMLRCFLGKCSTLVSCLHESQCVTNTAS